MSTPDQPEATPLTRRQLRELRNTASTPIISPADVEPAPAPEPAPPVVAPLPRAAEPIAADVPTAAEDVDLGAMALTRRARRQQERLRTASVPVIGAADVPSVVPQAPPPATAAVEGSEEGPVDAELVFDARPVAANTDENVVQEPVPSPEPASQHVDAVGEPPLVPQAGAAVEERAVVAPAFGAGLLAGEGAERDFPASFDQLLGRGSGATGALAAPNALILSQTPETGAFTSPIAATGEVLITGSYALPDSFGATGTMPGVADNKETDAVLVDSELPASSSPTPIAASAAISTIKSADDIIKPPAPEKGSRLMLTLVITAGALALALTGVLIVALMTGAFQ